MAKLTFILDDGETIEVPLHDSVTIGRADGNDVVVYDPRISSRHAELHFLSDGKFEVRDLASKAGTYVNGERVERKLLGHGDQVNFGPLKGEFSTEVVPAAGTPSETPEAEEAGKEEAGDVGAPQSDAEPEGVQPKEKSDKGFLSSVLAAMGAKSSNGGNKAAEPKAGKQERKQDAAPVAKAKVDEKPALPKVKAAGVTPETPKAPEAKPAEAKAAPAKQPLAKAPESSASASVSSPGKNANAPADAPASSASPAGTPAPAAAQTPAEVEAPRPPEVSPEAAVSAAPAPATPSVPVPAVASASPASPSPAASRPEESKSAENKTPAADALPEAGKPVAWNKNSRQENKPAQEASAKLKPAAETSAPPPKNDKPEAAPASAAPQDSPDLAPQASEVASAPVAPPAPDATVQIAPAPVSPVAPPAIEVAAEENLDVVMQPPAALAPSPAS
ncbi:MAG: FHA domain-containing protein, partial [Roseimicrobium sp.]